MKSIIIFTALILSSCATTPKEEIHTYICGPEEMEEPIIAQPVK